MSAASLSDKPSVEQKASEEKPSSFGELVLSKSSSHVDAGVRQRRLDRLHSTPATSQQSLSPLLEKAREEGEGEGEEGGNGKLRTGESTV